MKYSQLSNAILAITLNLSLLQVAFSAESIDSPRSDAAVSFLLTDYIENFNNGDSAAGKLIPFGTVRDPLVLEDSAGRTGTTGDAAALLKTVTGGFGSGEGENFIGFSMDVTSVLLESGTGATIDASGYNSISYFIKNQTDNSGSTVTAALELVVDDGSGNLTTWKQSPVVNLGALTVSGNNNGFTRFVLALKANNSNSVDGGFVKEGGTGSETLTSADLSKISKVNMVMAANGDTTTQRGIYVDDINFFDNVNIQIVHVDRIFAKSGSGGVFTLKAKLDRNGVPANDLAITVSDNNGNGDIVFTHGNVSGGGDNADGEVEFTYSVPDVSEIAEITVELSTQP